MGTYKKQKIATYNTCFCSAAKLTSKTITETIETTLNFLGARIAAINLFQVDLDKP